MLESKESTAGELHTSHSSFFLATTKVTINSQTNNFPNTNFKTKTTRHFKTQIHTSKFRFPTLLTTFTYFSLHTSFITLDYKGYNLTLSTDFQRHNKYTSMFYSHIQRIIHLKPPIFLQDARTNNIYLTGFHIYNQPPNKVHIHEFGIPNLEIPYTNTNSTTNQQISIALLSICSELHITAAHLHN